MQLRKAVIGHVSGATHVLGYLFFLVCIQKVEVAWEYSTNSKYMIFVLKWSNLNQKMPHYPKRNPLVSHLLSHFSHDSL